MDKLEILNTIPVVNWSAPGDTIEYIHIANTLENVNTLIKIGVSLKDISATRIFWDDLIDIAPFIFKYVDAKWFNDDGFHFERPE